MSHYENLPVPNEVNVGNTSAVGEFAKLAIALVLFCIVLVVVVNIGIRYLAPYIPFRYEVSLAASVSKELDNDTPSPTRQYLQKLTDSLAAHMALPDGMTLTVHTNSSRVPNALATFGGHIIVTQGLLDLVDSENALAMVLAHEIGHIKHRDPIAAAGSAVVISIVMGILFGNNDAAVIGNASGLLTQFNYSRAQESAADQAALDALIRHYGHTNGAETFFKKILETSWSNDASPEFLSTHPSISRRLASIESSRDHHSNGPLRPLPDFVRQSPPSSDAEQRNANSK